MAQNSEDLRVLRTRKLLQRALIEVTSQKGLASVTVRDITGRAMVNRSTFYRHFIDKYDLLGQYLDELYALIDSQVGGDDSMDGPVHGTEKLPDGLVSLLRHIQVNADFYRVMLGEKGDPAFCAQRFRRYIEKGLDELLASTAGHGDPNKPPLDLMVSYLLQAGVGAIAWWLENNQPIPPEQMAVWLKQLSQAVIKAALEPAEKAASRL